MPQYRYRLKGKDELIRTSKHDDYKYACVRNDGAVISMSRTYEGCVKSSVHYLKNGYYYGEYTVDIVEVEIF